MERGRTHMNRLELKELLKDAPNLLNKEIWIWGAGNTAQLYQEGLRRLELCGDYLTVQIAGYIDERYSGGVLGDHPIIAPEQFEKMVHNSQCVLICSIQPIVVKEIQRRCMEMHVEHHLMDEVILKRYAADIMGVYDILGDEQSKYTYGELIRARVTDCIVKDSLYCANHYFAVDAFQEANHDEVFIDCGAYDGDSIIEYLENRKNVFGKCIAFEPDENNFRKLRRNLAVEWKRRGLSEDTLCLYPYGVDKKNNISYVIKSASHEGMDAKLVDAPFDNEKYDEMTNSSTTTIRSVSIDEFVSEPFHFLKADIESYEYRLLLGAENSIKKYRPKLTICIYHSALDFFQIPILIKKILPNYNLAIRHHSKDLSETVLYAWE